MFRDRTGPIYLYAPDEGGGGGSEAAPGAAPWAADLEQRFTDPAVRGQVDEYLRSSIQPRMTQLEQQLAGRPDVPEEAAALYQDLVSDPRGTMDIIVNELLPDVADGWRNLFTPAEQAKVEEQAAAAGTTPQKLTLDMMPDELREMYEEKSANTQQSEYDGQVAALIDALKPEEGKRAANQALTEADKDFLHPFIQMAASNNGTFQDAANMYLAYREALRGGASQAAAGEAAAAAGEAAPAAAPITLGSEGGGSSGVTPPPTEVARGWNQFDDAIREFVRENRAAAPTTVGSV